jgi:type IV pilus assembly protein PilQ
MKNSAKDFIFGDGNTMNHMFRQFSMGAIAMAVMQVASAQVSITNIVPMQIPGQGTEIRVMFNGLPPQPQAYQLEQPSRLVLDFDKAQQSLKQGSIAQHHHESEFHVRHRSYRHPSQ